MQRNRGGRAFASAKRDAAGDQRPEPDRAHRLGNHPVFLALGFRRAWPRGLTWCALWLALGREGSLVAGTAKNGPPTPKRVGYRQLLL